MTLDEMQADIGAWGDTTFPSRTPLSIINHFDEEAQEFLDAHLTQSAEPHARGGDVTEEAADCLILLIQYAHVSGFSLFDAAMAKMAINRQREWNTTPEPAGHIKHVEVPS